MFGKPKSARLARIMDMTSPTGFARSIKEVKKGGVTAEEKRALVLTRNRAAASAKRRNLSVKERKQMLVIARMKLPSVTK